MDSWHATFLGRRHLRREVTAFMHRHAVAITWDRADLGSSDMMSLVTAKRVWQARLDPRRQTPSIGMYSHVEDR
jgi:hypothetical protein